MDIKNRVTEEEDCGEQMIIVHIGNIVRKFNPPKSTSEVEHALKTRFGKGTLLYGKDETRIFLESDALPIGYYNYDRRRTGEECEEAMYFSS
jgi:hypothetical protein